MKIIDSNNFTVMNRILERRMEKAFHYAIRKGLPPVEYMKSRVDMMIEHILRVPQSSG